MPISWSLSCSPFRTLATQSAVLIVTKVLLFSNTLYFCEK
jgi:hypothetical protein